MNTLQAEHHKERFQRLYRAYCAAGFYPGKKAKGCARFTRLLLLSRKITLEAWRMVDQPWRGSRHRKRYIVGKFRTISATKEIHVPACEPEKMQADGFGGTWNPNLLARP